MLPLDSPQMPAASPWPLQELTRCHVLLDRHCHALERLQRYLPEYRNDEAAREVAHGALRYFSTAARHHHEDEELALFPALLESMAGSDPVCIRELTTTLTQEHQELDRRWRALHLQLQALVEGQPVLLGEHEVHDFVSRYRAHIQLEDAELLPMARRLLSDAAITHMAHVMHHPRRRSTI